VVQFRPPPLRERGADVLELAEHFLKHYCAAMRKNIRTFSTAARQKLLSHHWPGNVRELRNVIERAVILETTGEVQARNLPDFSLESGLRKGDTPAATADFSLDDYLAQSEREYILATLARNHFSLTRAAEQLKISRHALRYRMQRLNIAPPAEPEEEPPPA
jgi:DNA-binding NtrC family response regulator